MRFEESQNQVFIAQVLAGLPKAEAALALVAAHAPLLGGNGRRRRVEIPAATDGRGQAPPACLGRRLALCPAPLGGHVQAAAALL
eukprot:9497857-Pyramimonas_sp.AAC.1